MTNTNAFTFRRSGRSHGNCKFSRNGTSKSIILAVLLTAGAFSTENVKAAQLWAGAAKVDITNTEALPVNDRLYAKALVLRVDTTTVAIVTVDAVAIGEIGYIGNDYLGKVRSQIEKELNIKPANVMINASHCHGAVRSDADKRTFQAVKAAAQNFACM